MPVMVAIKQTGERKRKVTHLKLKKKNKSLAEGKARLRESKA